MANRPLLAENLRIARRASGLSQKAAAERLETTDVTVSNHERGVTKPSDDQLDSYAALYGVSVKALRYEEGLAGTLRHPPAAAEPEPQAQVPRLARNLPLAVREYLAQFHLRLVKGGASEDEIDEAMTLLRSPDVFSYFKGGKLAEYNEEDVLDGMRSLAEDVVIPRLQKLGRKVK